MVVKAGYAGIAQPGKLHDHGAPLAVITVHRGDQSGQAAKEKQTRQSEQHAEDDAHRG